MTIDNIHELLRVIATTHNPFGMDLEWVELSLSNTPENMPEMVLKARQTRQSCRSEQEYIHGPHPYIDLADMWEIQDIANDPGYPWTIDEA